MNEPLDVSLRVRMNYEAAAKAREARGDLDAIGAAARRLGAIDAGAKLGAGLKAAAGQAQGAKRDILDLAAATGRLGQTPGADKLEAALKNARAPANALARDILDVRSATERLGRDSGIERLERELREAGRRADELERKLGGVSRRLERGRHMRDGREFGNEFLDAAGVGGGLRFGMSRAAVGGLAAGAGVATVAGGLALSTREAIKFETAMAEVQKAVNDLTPEGLKEMERAILRTSRTTGIAKEEMAKLVAQAGFAGRPTQELTRFAEFGAKAAVAFDMTAEEAGDALAKMGNVFHLPQKGIEDLADAVNVLGDSTAAKEKQIVNFLYRAGANGQAIGMTANQVAAFGAAIISTGKEEEVAATGFNAIAMKLANPQLAHDKEFGKGLREIGLSARRLKAEMATSPVEAYLKVLERINKLPQSKKLEAAQRIGGMEYGDDLVGAAGAVDQIREALAKLQDQATRSGSVEKTFAIFNASTQASIDRASASIKSLATHIGTAFTPAVKAAAEWTQKLFDRWNEGFEFNEKVDALAKKLKAGGKPTADEQKQLDTDPKFRAHVEAQQMGPILSWDLRPKSGRVTDWNLQPKQRPWWQFWGTDPTPPKATPPSAAPARQPPAWVVPPRLPGLLGRPAIPGTGKRAELADEVRPALAAYNEEVERGLQRTEIMVHKAALRMRPDLELASGVRPAVYRGGGDGARLYQASWGGGGSAGDDAGDSSWRRSGGGPAGGGGGRRFGGRRRGGGRRGDEASDDVAPSSALARVGLSERGVESGLDAFGLHGPKTRGDGIRPIDPNAFARPEKGAGYNPRLAASRKKFFDELDRDPQLRRDVIKTASMENGHSASSMTSVLESMVNRAQMRGYSSLNQSIHDGFYGPVNRGGLAGDLSAQHRKYGEAAIEAVRSGSNQIEYRTDQGMLTDPGARQYMREPDHSGWKKFQGENYFYMGQKGRRWAREQEAADRAGLPRTGGPFGLAGFNMPGEAPPMSARYVDPSRLQLNARGQGERAGGAGRSSSPAGPIHTTQNFYGGFDEKTVAMRSTLEQNRAIRRAQAGALHDLGRIA